MNACSREMSSWPGPRKSLIVEGLCAPLDPAVGGAKLDRADRAAPYRIEVPNICSVFTQLWTFLGELSHRRRPIRIAVCGAGDATTVGRR